MDNIPLRCKCNFQAKYENKFWWYSWYLDSHHLTSICNLLLSWENLTSILLHFSFFLLQSTSLLNYMLSQISMKTHLLQSSLICLLKIPSWKFAILSLVRYFLFKYTDELYYSFLFLANLLSLLVARLGKEFIFYP